VAGFTAVACSIAAQYGAKCLVGALGGSLSRAVTRDGRIVLDGSPMSSCSAVGLIEILCGGKHYGLQKKVAV
jgi:hypothetical protein